MKCVIEELVRVVKEPEWKVMLLEIIHRQNFDPWDIDVSALATEYLNMIRKMQEANLVVPANALVVCSILLHMKAGKIAEMINPPQPELVEPEEVEPLIVPEAIPQEEEKDRHRNVVLVPPTRVAPRRVTLDELLEAIDRVMRARRSVQKLVNIEVEEPPLPELNTEDVEAMVEEVYGKVLELADREGMLTFSQLLDHFDWVTALYAILYLANEGRIAVWQEEPFKEVFIAVIGNGGKEDR